MAERRMMSKKVTDTDDFLDMPLSTQALYFHFIQNADDDGFVSNPKTIVRKISATKNDLDLLFVKKFVIPFESGICVIRHWKIHNYIQNDRYTPTMFLEEKNQLILSDNKEYEMSKGIKLVSNLDTQTSIDKDSIDNICQNFDKPEQPAISKTLTTSPIMAAHIVNILDEFLLLYSHYPCSINKSKKTSLNLYYGWLVDGKHITVMGCKKLVKYNHIQIKFALKHFIETNSSSEEQFIPRLPTFLGEKTLCDFVVNSKPMYEAYMQKTYGDEWDKIKFNYVKDE